MPVCELWKNVFLQIFSWNSDKLRPVLKEKYGNSKKIFKKSYSLDGCSTDPSCSTPRTGQSNTADYSVRPLCSEHSGDCQSLTLQGSLGCGGGGNGWLSLQSACWEAEPDACPCIWVNPYSKVRILPEPEPAEWHQPTAGFSSPSAEQGSQAWRTDCTSMIRSFGYTSPLKVL